MTEAASDPDANDAATDEARFLAHARDAAMPAS